MDELAAIFADLGFAVAEGPEIENDWHNFTALNIPPDHPARAMQDTFYLPRSAATARRMVLRTHTSPVQIRTMLDRRQKSAADPAIIAPGRVYRIDNDATHTPMFHQVEGLVIDRDDHTRPSQGTLIDFLQRLLRARRRLPLRFRAVATSRSPSRRPRSTSAGRAKGGELRSAAATAGWRSWAAAWCIRSVLANCGLDPDEWQGFAFGMGIDRLAMLKYGMDDLRAFFDGDIRWLRHYGFRPLDVPTLHGGRGR